MDTIDIDLRKNPDLSALIADMQPGDPVTLHTTIQHKDDQTVKLTIEDAEEGEAKPDDTETGDEEATAAAAPEAAPAPPAASPMANAMGGMT